MLSLFLPLALCLSEAPLQPAAGPSLPLAQDGPVLRLEAPTVLVKGQPFEVKVTIEAGPSPTPVAGWLLNSAAFLVDGEPLGKRTDEQFIELSPGSKLTLSLNLEPMIKTSKDFELVYAKNIYPEGPIKVQTFAPATGVDGVKLDFLAMAPEKLAEYMVVMRTNRGTMIFKFWPEVAPNHVRNMLDLAQAGFYDGILFHRVGQGFMIQGGDPLTKDPGARARWGTGGGPRQLQAEFSERPHQRGVLSAARGGGDINSASSQFFVMHGRNPGLDRQYSCYGELLPGHSESFETLDRIVSAPGTAGADRTITPKEPQRIEQAFVVVSGVR
jgi:cyclophilin family peptidyl-prolyl cis-trans isomerase